MTFVAPATPAAQRHANNRLLLILGLIAVGSMLFFLFGFRSLYRMWCSITGTRLNPNNPEIALAMPTATGRFLKVHFESKVFDGLPIQFSVETPEDRIEVGRDAKNTYKLKNLSDRELHIRPVHQAAPINATRSFGMRICFCFQNQILKPGEEKVFPVVYRFAPDLDPRINDVSLCYSIFDIADGIGSADLKRVEGEAKRAIVAEPAAEPGAEPLPKPKAGP